MPVLGKYCNQVTSSRFLWVSETEREQGVVYRFAPDDGILVAAKILDTVPARFFCLGSVLFTRDSQRQPLRAILLCAGPEFHPGSAVWCVPAGTARLSSKHTLLLARPDRALYSVSEHKTAVSAEDSAEAARFYAEHILDTPAPSVAFGPEQEAKRIVEEGLQAYRLEKHARMRF